MKIAESPTQDESGPTSAPPWNSRRAFGLTISALALVACHLAGTVVVWAAEPLSPAAWDELGKKGPAYELPDLTALAARSPSKSGEIREIIELYSADEGTLQRFYDVEVSPLRGQQMEHFYRAWQEGTEKLDFNKLMQQGKVDYILLRNLVNYRLRHLALERKRNEEIGPLVPFLNEIAALHEQRQVGEPLDYRALSKRLTELNEQIQALQKSIAAELPKEKNPSGKPANLPGPVVQRAIRTVNELRETLKNWFTFYNGYDPMFTWWAGQPYKDLDKSVDEYSSFLRSKVLGLSPEDRDAIVGDPIGRDALMVELAGEMIPYTPEELIAIAEKELVWCEKEMLRASRDLGYGDDWKKALEYVKTLHVPPGEQPALIRQQAMEAIEFLEKRDLLTIPPLARQSWRVRMMTPERQKINPFFTGGEVISVSYPTDTMTNEQKLMSMRGNNIHFSRATVHHELIAGHYLQRFMNARNRPYRGSFRTPFWTEGWSLYWEMLLWDQNFPETPENRIGMLFWRMHRSARIMFSLGFHLGKMTVQDCIDLLVNRIGHELDNATAEVRRSFGTSYDPLYQCAYLLGGLQFYSLHRELVDSGKMTNREFHDAILQLNSMPVEMVRASLINQSLNRDFSSSWKFYD